MKTYTVEITETLRLSVDCETSGPEDAEDIIRTEYKNGKYVLGAEHFTDLEINAFERKW